uniref:NADH dehydrogenase subunit 5 n=1 Tax=Rhynchophorus phoenicis TaxID=206503 RepID=UPI0028FCF2EA|nr:NADH dehydrogenase subunit 5 [Rhynchophorus phoenicis]WNH29324.1 NADH dehydrogenase subunit 5 [Rhynchophorus phoenicis]
MIFKSYFSLLLTSSLGLFFIGMFLVSCDFYHQMELSLLSLNSVTITYTIIIDWMSITFMSFVFFISAAVVKYSEEYMGDDFHKGRFIYLVVLFIISMAFMVMSLNMVSILLGWDGLGLVSYALVIFYQNIKSFNAGMLTALTNRLGDVAILMCIAMIFNFGTWNFMSLLDLFKKDKFFEFITVLVILAAITKSAQIPFSAWLPAAMAAPTPVSALVHSSTLVTAGVYLLIRFSESIPEYYMQKLMLASLLTMFMSGYAANFEFDLKKIIALSTLSQLGMMVFILTMGEIYLSFFHLLVHALFKALLFMCAGMIIYNSGNCQDIRYMGSLAKVMPLTCTYLNICSMSLCGLPFLSGFYSKDLMAETFSMGGFSLFIYFVFFVSIGLTVSYSFRLLYYTFSGNYMGVSFNGFSEGPKEMLKSMSLLIYLVIFMGSVMVWLVFPTPYFILLPFNMKFMTLLMVLFGAWMGHGLSQMSLSWSNKSLWLRKWVMFISGMWNLPNLSSLIPSKFFLYLGKQYSKLIDQGWLEFYGSQQLYKKLSDISKFIQLFSKSNFKVFLLLTIIWLSYAMMFMN